jgi:hypothetical protein
VKIIGLLNWYEEHPGMLAECVASAAKICDHLVAVDGAYAMFPGALRMPSSGRTQAEAILRVTAGAGIGCTIHTLNEPWWEGEVGKRSTMFELGRIVAGPDDWFFRIDADEMVTEAPADTRRILRETKLDVAEAMLWERDTGSHTTLRCLFRALPDLRVEQNHYTVTATVDGEKRYLSGLDAEPAEQLLDLRIEHRTGQRPLLRQQQKATYYSLLPDIEKPEAVQ